MSQDKQPDQLAGSSKSWLRAPTIDEVRSAARALEGQAIETPLLEHIEVNDHLGMRLLIKAETAQRTGSFKFRGAFNRISQLDEAERKRGVIAYSSGNHAQAVACASKLADTSALIVMPADAPPNKIARTRELGAQIITYERATQTREDVAEHIEKERGLIMVPPNEDARVMAGAGTAALELIHQAEIKNATIDAVLIPCGGGGLTAATALVFEALSPATSVYGVEPELFDDTRRSLAARTRLANPKGRTTICDAIMTDTPGALTFSINKDRLAGILTVSDDEVRAAMKFAFDWFKVVIEPGAAVALAAVLSNKIDRLGKTIAVFATGGNVDAHNFCTALTAAENAQQRGDIEG